MKKLILIFVMFLMPTIVFADDPINTSPIPPVEQPINYNATNLPLGNAIRGLVVTKLQNDVPNTDFMTPGAIPIETKIAKLTIDSMTYVAQMLYPIFMNIITWFLITLLAWWIALESYALIESGSDTKKFAESIVKKSIIVVIWIAILQSNPAQIFMFFAGPIISLGTYISDLILTTTVGVDTLHTCDAIRAYVASDPLTTVEPFLSNETTANMLCMPARISTFFYQCISTGFYWMKYGFGTSGLMVITGIMFVIVFIINAFNFAISVLSVIADLMLTLFFLPFVAIKTCFGGGDTSVKNPIVKTVFQTVTGMFATGDISKLIETLVKALFYFCILSVIAGMSYALMQGAFNTTGDLRNITPSMNDTSFMTVFLCGLLTLYMIRNAEKFSEKLGGAINREYAKLIDKNIKSGWKDLNETAKKLYTSAIKKKSDK